VLQQAGIPGIKYLDAGSRGPQPQVKLVGGKPYDPADPMHGAAQALEWTGGDRAAAADQLERMSAGPRQDTAQAEQMRNSAAVLRGNQSVPPLTEGPAPGSHNYVVFDPSMLNIVRKYAVPAFATAGAIPAAMGGSQSQ
jgi:hypothetical protein